MKNLVRAFAVFAAAVFCFSGCGKKSETAPEKSAASYPLPEPPVVVDCEPGIPGGRFIIAELGDPKTFNPIMANEASSIDIGRFMFWSLLNFDVPTQESQTGPGGIVDKFAGRQNVDVHAAEKSALERRRTADGGRRGFYLERHHLQSRTSTPSRAIRSSWTEKNSR